MERHYAAFDIETATLVPEDSTDWMKHRPLGISCAATCTGSGVSIWYGRTPEGSPAARLDQPTAQRLVSHFADLTESGYTLVTWNGLGFDLDILAEESGMVEACRNLALEQVDMMFHFFCLQGYPLGLDKAARGMGLPGKPDGMTGALAPNLWAEGRHQEVLDYLKQDVEMTLRLADAVERRGCLNWTSNRGKPQQARIARWLTVAEARNLPLPDTSWMTSPLPRRRFTGWVDR